MSETDTTPDAAKAAQTEADAAWGEHDTARAPLRDELLTALTNLEGVTGLQAGPGSERLADAMLDFAEFHADELVAAQAARAKALAAQDRRDVALAAEPPAEPPAAPSMLDTAEPLEVREWLKGANDADVTALLLGVTDRDAQVEWASQMMAWGRQDGNVATVFAAINAVLVPPNSATIDAGGATGGTGGTSSYRGQGQVPASASADDDPTAREDASDQVPDGDVDAIVSWVHHGADDTVDVNRAKEAFATEQGRTGGARPEVLSALVDIIDAAAPPADPAPAPAPEGALPLYEYVGPEGSSFDATEWPEADAKTPEGHALYTHPTTDTPGGPPMQLPDDSLWKVYEPPTPA